LYFGLIVAACFASTFNDEVLEADNNGAEDTQDNNDWNDSKDWNNEDNSDWNQGDEDNDWDQDNEDQIGKNQDSNLGN
jgi:hypothetical protein